MKNYPMLTLLAAVIAGLAGFAMGWKRASPEVRAISPPSTLEKKEGREPPPQETGSSKEARDSSSKLAGSAAVPASESNSPKKRFLSLAFQRWPKQARRHLLWELFLANPEGQRRLFGHLMASTNPGDWEAGQDFLIGTRDTDLVRQMADAFASEINPDRRAMLAYALGGNASHASARPGIEQALNSQDPAILKRVLTRLAMGDVKDSPEASLRVEAGLKAIIGSTLGQDVRVAAVRSLRGGVSEDQVRFALDLAIRDSNPEVQRAAVNVLPVQYMSHPPLLEEQLGGLWILVRDESRDSKVRRSAASVLWDHARFRRVKLNDADQGLLNMLLESKK